MKFFLHTHNERHRTELVNAEKLPTFATGSITDTTSRNGAIICAIGLCVCSLLHTKHFWLSLAESEGANSHGFLTISHRFGVPARASCRKQRLLFLENTRAK